MAVKPLPSPELLRQLLRYEPETGKLFWLQTPNDFVKSNCGYADRVKKSRDTRFAGNEAFTALRNGYYVGTIRRRTYSAHRVIWCILHGYWPNQIDHIDHDRGNNKICNLRDVDGGGNMRNRPIGARNKSGVVGVHWRKRERLWRAKIRIDGVDVYLGYFHDFAEACEARRKAEAANGYHPNHGAVRCK